MGHTRLKNNVAFMLQTMGLRKVIRYLNRRKAVVLLYHSVTRDNEEIIPPWGIRESEFRWQMEYLARNHRVLSLSDYVDRLVSGRPVPEHTVVITFDDGFRDNYTIAYPILRQLGLPATIFLVTGYLDSDQALWPDVLFQAVYRTKVECLDLRDLGDGFHRLTSLPERHAAFASLIEYLKTLPSEKKNQRLGEIAGRLNLELEKSPHDASFALLRRSEILQMAEEGLIMFGVHTESHEILTRIPLNRALREIQVSKQKVEGLLGYPARFFAYPNGTESDFNDTLKHAVKDMGFACAFASRGGQIDEQPDLFALPRLGVGPESNRAYFKLKLVGGVDWFQHLKDYFLERKQYHGAHVSRSGHLPADHYVTSPDHIG